MVIDLYFTSNNELLIMAKKLRGENHMTFEETARGFWRKKNYNSPGKKKI